MSLLTALERRTSPENPQTDLNNPAAWLWEALGGRTSSSGQIVTDQTALTLTTVWACVRVLAEGVASIPLNIYERVRDGGKDPAPDHPLYERLHDRPNQDQSSFAWRETLMAHLALRGNSFHEKEFNRRGELLGLWPIRPDRVSVARVNGEKVFKITTVTGNLLQLTDREILHIPGLSYDGLVGYSPIRYAADAIGLGLAAQEHGSKFFENGAEIGGILQHPGRLSDNAAKHLRESFEAKHKGSKNARRALIAEEGMTWQAVGLSNRDSQYLETRKFQVSEIARVYRVPPHMVGDLEKATFSNIEQQSIDFVTHTLRPWLVRIEQILNWELFGDVKTSKFFCEFNVDGLLRGDSAARAAFYQSMITTGVYSINDARVKENLNPIAGGDNHFMQGAMAPIAKLIAPTPVPALPAPAMPKALPTGDPAADEPMPMPARARVHDACYRLYRQAAERCVTKYVQRARVKLKKLVTDGDVEEFRAWARAFFAEEVSSAARTFLPATMALADIVGVEAAQTHGHADAIGRRLTDALGAELARTDAATAGACLDAWEATRADTIATAETALAITFVTALPTLETAA